MDPITILRTASAALMALVTGAFADASTREPEDEYQGVDVVQLLKRHKEPAPPPMPLPEGALGLRNDDSYQAIRDLSLAIERRPDPAAYELRADLWERLGWHQRAKWDRARARALRGTAAVLP